MNNRPRLVGHKRMEMAGKRTNSMNRDRSSRNRRNYRRSMEVRAGIASISGLQER
jgi:hypothetical protein